LALRKEIQIPDASEMQQYWTSCFQYTLSISS